MGDLALGFAFGVEDVGFVEFFDAGRVEAGAVPADVIAFGLGAGVGETQERRGEGETRRRGDLRSDGID